MKTDYYIPFARYFSEQDAEGKIVMHQVRENGDYGIWIQFLLFMILNRNFIQRIILQQKRLLFWKRMIW